VKIVVEDVAGKEILTGEFCYLEGGTTNGFPSFNITLKDGEDIYFYCEKKEELDELIDLLQEIREEAKKSNQN